MVQMIKMVMLTLFMRLQARPKDERGEAVPWLIVLGAGIGIAYFAGDAVWDFARSLVGNLGGQ
ncbi:MULTISPECIES: hypothetical protein [Actinomycetes]|jgi:hypothetical protein|uniref:Uncharacterized protein n=1 Tax=Paenarthrobacter aurescens (strain TC1) TaxID=290340 RepID=A1RCC9_PAEAT|nr:MULTISPECIES: hypothetical protein [Actinomycetes]ABM10589.1 hypothetical protein AAur_pTC10017 [Paenarthrobacter aurescens TC1]